MTPIPVPHRWLAALLGASLLVDLTLAATRDGLTAGLPALPGAFALCVCAYLALGRPVIGALAGAAVLVGSTLVIRLTDGVPVSLGIQSIVLSELVAGSALVVLVIWRAAPWAAAGCVAVLVFAALFAMIIRGDPCAGVYCAVPDPFSFDMYRSLVFGLCVLLLSIAIGSYLRYVFEPGGIRSSSSQPKSSA